MMLALVALAVMQEATPQEAAAPAGDEIVVTAPLEPFAVPIATLRKAVAAFDKDRARLAPQGELWFVLRPRAGVPAEGLTVALSDGQRSIPIALDARSRFHLPPLPEGDAWALRANRRGKSLAFRAMVRTPGFDGEQRRIGDLRMHCRVNYAVQSDRFSFFQRTAFGMVGGCDTRRIAFYFREARPLAGATLRDKDLPVRENSFFAPIGVKAVGNDERITLRFR